LTNDVPNYQSKENNQNCNGYRIQVQKNRDDMDNVRCKASKNEKINEFAMNSKNMNIRDLYRGITKF
jgi:hypothetical protein